MVRGKDELRAVWESQVQAVDIRVEVEEFISAGQNQVVAPMRMVARGSGSEITLTAAVTWVFTFDASGLIESVEVSEGADALEAAVQAQHLDEGGTFESHGKRMLSARYSGAMSQENVEIVRRVTDAYNRLDVGAMLDELHPEIEWHPWLQLQLGGGATVYRGHEGVRKGIRDWKKRSLRSRQSTEIRDLGERVVAIGHHRGRGKESGAITESPLAWIVEFKSGKVIRVREYLDPKQALEAVGLSE